jgi:hypothetical protein
LLFLSKSLKPTLLKGLDELANSEPFPFGWLESALGFIATLHWVDHLLMLKFNMEVKGIDVGIGIFTTTDSLDQLHISLRKLHIFVVESITNLHPPLLVVLSFNELVKLILASALRLGDFLSLNVVALMIIELIPLHGHVADSQEDFFVRGVIAVHKILIVLPVDYFNTFLILFR